MGVNGIYGLSGSGLDIESMVKVGMMSKQSQYEKMQQTYTLNEWKKEAFLDVYDKLQTYNTSTLSEFKMSSNMNARTAVSSNDKISVSANASAPAMTHQITVDSTATNAYLVGTGHLERNTGAESSTSTLIKDSLFKAIQAGAKDADGNVTQYTLTTWDGEPITLNAVISNGKVTGYEDSEGKTAALSFVIGDGSNTGVVKTGKDDIINAAITGPVSTSGTYTVKITSTGTAASASYTNTDLKDAKSLFRSAIASNSGWNSVTGITLSDDGKTFNVSGTTVVTTGIFDTGTETETNTATIAASETALQFRVTVNGNTDTTDIDITYGDIAKIITDPGSDLNDLVDLLNQKFASEDINIDAKAAFDTDTGKLSFSSFDSDVKNIQLTGEGDLGQALLNTLYKNSDSDGKTAFTYFEIPGAPGEKSVESLNFELKGEISNASGTISLNGTTKYLTFNGNTATYDGITIEALEKAQDSLTVKSTNNVIYSYKDILDGKTLYDLASDINNNGTNVRATYDGVNDTFSLYNLKAGESNGIVVAAQNSQTAKLLNGMGLKQVKGGEDLSETDAVKFEVNKATSLYGTNASVLVDGVKYEDIDSNKLTVNGVTYNFGNVTEKGTSATVTVDQDVDKIVDNVKSFVESYNKLLSDLYDVYNEKPNSSFKPLTDAQKAEMTEEQIKKWEEKAKSGMLYHDTNIRRIIDNLRGAISSSIDSINTGYDNAYSIGISTTGIYGQLQLNEDKLKEALNKDPDSVYNIFAKLDSTTTAANSAYSTSEGIAQRIGDIMTNGLKSISNVAGRSSDISEDSQLNNLMRNLQTKMSSFRSMMDAFEDALYKKYDAMESTLAMLGTQLNYVTSSFA